VRAVLPRPPSRGGAGAGQRPRALPGAAPGGGAGGPGSRGITSGRGPWCGIHHTSSARSRARPPAGPRRPPGMSRGRLLLVEDEPGLVMALTDRLTREGYHVTSARDGEAGLHCACRESFDLVILDVMLPRRNGFEVCREL